MTAPDDTPSTSRRSSMRTVVVGVAIVAAILGGILAVAFSRSGDEPATAGSGRNAIELARPADEAFPLPPATLEGFAGGPPVKLTDYRGKPTVIYFWATWCKPCVKEMPEFVKAEERFGDEVQLLGIDVEDSPLNAEPFVEKLGIDYPLAIDPHSEFRYEVGVVPMPATLLVDEDGIVRYRYTGPLDAPKLYELVKQHLGEDV